MEQTFQSSSDGLTILHVAGLEFAKAFRQINNRTVDHQRVDRLASPTPPAPTTGVVDASLAEGSSFLNHGPMQVPAGYGILWLAVHTLQNGAQCGGETNW